MSPFSALKDPTRFLFFTGKGGVGKTSLSCASAIALADRGLRILLVSTDPASNLDEMLGVALSDIPTPVPGVPGLSAMNIDPEAAADDYRTRVIDQLGPQADAKEISTVREQLSGACTTEIAAFDEFVGLLADDAPEFDHIIFDTAPTGHTLRLLSLPKAWTGFLETNERGASCLGPHSGLKMQEDRFREALRCLGDPARTTIVLVTRADKGAIREAARTSDELKELGLSNQLLAVNGRFHASDPTDAVAAAFVHEQDEALAGMPPSLAGLPRDEFPLLAFDMVGIPALRALMSPSAPAPAQVEDVPDAGRDLPRIAELVDEIAAGEKGLVMVMGKGGVGKTTVAAAIAVGLAKRGHAVHLTTTDPAAHLTFVVEGEMPGLTVDRIDPAVETERYVDKIMTTRGRDLDEDGKALLREDLASPCTEEVAVFHAFSRVVAEARSAFVVIDTAPTGHTLLLLDATGAYHRQMTRHLDPDAPGRLVTPLMRLQDEDYTRVILVTLPETTPVSEAGALQDDLKRAGIEPYGWVINKSMAATGTRDRLLRSRLKGEHEQIDRVREKYARRVYALEFRTEPPVGVEELRSLT
ncbi:MAG TPA: arsenical pump-driving ATPase [Rhizobium sp.]|nr:arsenical pump-driving ATPase [Rhizobium sp.]